MRQPCILVRKQRGLPKRPPAKFNSTKVTIEQYVNSLNDTVANQCKKNLVALCDEYKGKVSPADLGKIHFQLGTIEENERHCD